MLLAKNWDRHVAHAEEIARTPAFRALRDEILSLAEVDAEATVVDVGSGTGLLTLAVAERVRTVWAVDVARSMGDYLGVKAASQGLANVEIVTASAASLPLADGVADLVVSNYCFHHLRDDDKRRALGEIARVLAPGGRLVFADMMFRVGVAAPRDRRIIATKVRLIARRGLPGLVRLARGVLRQLAGRGEHPASAAWWEQALADAGFERVAVRVLDHEGGIAVARRPAVASPAARRVHSSPHAAELRSPSAAPSAS